MRRCQNLRHAGSDVVSTTHNLKVLPENIPVFRCVNISGMQFLWRNRQKLTFVVLLKITFNLFVVLLIETKMYCN